MLRSERLLLSFVDLKILNRNVNEFSLMSDVDDADYRVKLTVYLKIRKVKVSPSISVAHKLVLKKGPAIYPVRRVEFKTFIIAAGNPSLRKDTSITDSYRKRLSSEWSTVQHSMATRKILTTLKPIPLRFSESPSTEKYLSNPYSFPIRQQVSDISRVPQHVLRYRKIIL